MVWRELFNHSPGYYFYVVHPIKRNIYIFKKKKSMLVCPNVLSTICPILHGRKFPVLEALKDVSSNFDENSNVHLNDEE